MTRPRALLHAQPIVIIRLRPRDPNDRTHQRNVLFTLFTSRRGRNGRRRSGLCERLGRERKRNEVSFCSEDEVIDVKRDVRLFGE